MYVSVFVCISADEAKTVLKCGTYRDYLVLSIDQTMCVWGGGEGVHGWVGGGSVVADSSLLCGLQIVTPWQGLYKYCA